MTLKYNLLILGSAVLLVGTFSARVSSHSVPVQVAATAPATQSGATYVGSQACQRCHTATYERWSKTRMANVVADPKVHPEVVLPDFSKPDPLLTFKLDDVAFVYGSKWKQRYFTKRRQRLLSAAGAVGRRQPRVAAVLRAAQHRLVGAALSGRQHAAADRSALRRLPFGQLRRQDQGGHGMERRLREVPRARQRHMSPNRPPRTSSIPRSWISSAPTTPAFSATRRDSRCTNPIEGKYVRLAGRVRAGQAAARTSGNSKSTSSARRPSRISPTAPRTRTGCRATTSCRA